MHSSVFYFLVSIVNEATCVQKKAKYNMILCFECKKIIQNF